MLSAATAVLPLYITLLSNCGSLFTFSSAEHKRIIHESVKRTAGASGVLQKGVSGVSEVFGARLFLVLRADEFVRVETERPL